MEHHKISKAFDGSAVTKFVTRKQIRVKDLLNDQNSVKKKGSKLLC